MARLQRTPGETHILRLALGIVLQLIKCLWYLHQRILLYPVGILKHPLAGILLVSRQAVSLSHGCKPFVAVQLPAQFIVLHRPIAPVDVFPVIERRLVSVVHVESMFQRIVRPATFALAERKMFQVQVGRRHTRPRAVIRQQFFGGTERIARIASRLYFLQTGIVQVQQLESTPVEHLCPHQGCP